MLLIEDMIVDDEILTLEFACELDKCRGRCCVIGNVGPPLTRAEAQAIDEVLPAVAPELPAANQQQIAQAGAWRDNGRGLYGAILPGGGPCVFAVETGGIWLCALQRLTLRGRLVKPLSCRMFPLWIDRSGAMYHVQLHLYAPCHLCLASGAPLLESLAADIIASLGRRRYRALLQARAAAR